MSSLALLAVGGPPMLCSAHRATVYTVYPNKSQYLVEMNEKHLARAELVSFRSNQKIRDTLQRAIGSSRSENMSYSVITPYRMSNDPGDLKSINAGDGFILKAVVKLLEPYQCEHIFSSRVTLSHEDINKINGIDLWFLDNIKKIVELEDELKAANGELSADMMRKAKEYGFSDKQLALILGKTELEVWQERKQLGVTPFFKSVDTCAAEFAAFTPYYYSTYEEETET